MSKMENTFLWAKAKGGGGDVTKAYVDEQDAKLGVRIDNTVTINTSQMITGHKGFTGNLQCSTEPTTDSDVVNKKYVDGENNKNVKLLGSQDIGGNKNFLNYTKFSDGINMNSLRIQHLGTPTGATDGANKSYVDAQDKIVRDYATTLKHPNIPFNTKTYLGFTVGGPWKANSRFMESSTAGDFEIDSEAVLIMGVTITRKKTSGEWVIVLPNEPENLIFYTGASAPQPLKYRITARADYALDIRLYIMYSSKA